MIDLNSYNNKGIIFFKLKKYDKAIECFDKANKISPDGFQDFKNKGIVLYKLGKRFESLKYF
jgi:tetratricopeptide (TPR) repeat protein